MNILVFYISRPKIPKIPMNSLVFWVYLGSSQERPVKAAQASYGPRSVKRSLRLCSERKNSNLIFHASVWWFALLDVLACRYAVKEKLKRSLRLCSEKQVWKMCLRWTHHGRNDCTPIYIYIYIYMCIRRRLSRRELQCNLSTICTFFAHANYIYIYI